jgi:hypothetical protein
MKSYVFYKQWGAAVPQPPHQGAAAPLTPALK